MIGEVTVNIDSVRVAQAYSGLDKLNACYTTDLRENCNTAANLKRILDLVRDQIGFGWCVSNHDFSRHNSALGNETQETARFYALLISCMPGPWLMYQGEEWGLPQPDHLKQTDVQDPFDLIYWPDGPGRSGARVPLPWAHEIKQNYGFSEGTPWLPMNWDKYQCHDVQEKDEASILAFYREVITLCRELQLNRAQITEVSDRDNILQIKYRKDGNAYQALFTFEAATYDLAEYDDHEVVIATCALQDRRLPAFSGVIYRLNQS